MAHQHVTGPFEPKVYPVTLSSGLPAHTIRAGDLVAIVNSRLVPAQNIAWNTNEATTQTDFATVFAGLATGNVTAGSADPRQLEVGISQDGECVFDLAVAVSGSALEVGSFIGPNGNSGTALAQGVESVPSKARAVAILTRRAEIGATKCYGRLVNTVIKR